MGLFDTNLGALLIGVLFNTFLYGIVTLQYALYHNAKFNDPLWIRATVLVLFFLDTFHSASVIYLIWVYAIENYTNPLILFTSIWPYPFTVVVTAITAYMTQLFLAYRMFRLTGQRIVYLIILVAASATFLLGLVAGEKAWRTVSLAQIPALRPILIPWLCLEVGVDAMISSVLLYALSKSRTGFPRSDNIIKRLMRTSIQTGLCSGIFSILSMTFFIASPQTHFFGMFGIPISRVYTNTLMDTLLTRQALRKMLHKEGENGSDFDSAWTRENSVNRVTDNSVQLHVRREVRTEVYFDDSIPPTPLSTFKKYLPSNHSSPTV
ncbi:hypothetical protein BDQ12DRAFT_464061 [Crucibulum laeve]|uniref:DUF6534 domain-containing protein n=1 Tax=Crucibulum laeve TaxID=68775 RepID=A0A5C3M5K3_9AGAR|nr:hypothetical protein BDQ12DRAFT_464061 [Crucibulum laeve]